MLGEIMAIVLFFIVITVSISIVLRKNKVEPFVCEEQSNDDAQNNELPELPPEEPDWSYFWYFSDYRIKKYWKKGERLTFMVNYIIK